MPPEQGSVGTRLEEQLHGIALDSAPSRANRERTVRVRNRLLAVLRRRRLSGFVPFCNPLRSSAGRGCELPGDGPQDSGELSGWLRRHGGPQARHRNYACLRPKSRSLQFDIDGKIESSGRCNSSHGTSKRQVREMGSPQIDVDCFWTGSVFEGVHSRLKATPASELH